MRDIYGLLVHDWVLPDATRQLDEPSSAPVEQPTGPVAPPDPQQTLAPPDPRRAPTGPFLTRPPAAPTGPSTSGSHSSEGTPAAPVALEKVIDDIVKEGCPAPSAVLKRKRKESPVSTQS
ncbi:hypothetical protein JOB18_016774 [Solea senegalensis]|uniref:Uncharacterized protein n=1 Tax=Solea senegalensis TaxID=28829 RepID=A0AAV6RUF1_SOLSE|nr:hypothetical protein JOB18_016774 [Solea senegalensis]